MNIVPWDSHLLCTFHKFLLIPSYKSNVYKSDLLLSVFFFVSFLFSFSSKPFKKAKRYHTVAVC